MTYSISLENPFYEELATSHRSWLKSFHTQHSRAWERLVKTDLEAALSESGVRRLLESKGVIVSPGEGTKGVQGGPDFRCVMDNTEFFVEVGNIAKEKADEITGIVVGGTEAYRFTSLNESIFNKCDAKAKQCAKRNAPVLLAIATFSAASLQAFAPPYPQELLTGKVMHALEIDRESKRVIGESRHTDLEHAAFLCLESDGFVQARPAISGLLLCGLVYRDFFVGVSNPKATYPFDVGLIPGLSFLAITVDDENLQLRTASNVQNRVDSV